MTALADPGPLHREIEVQPAATIAGRRIRYIIDTPEHSFAGETQPAIHLMFTMSIEEWELVKAATDRVAGIIWHEIVREN